MLWRCWRRRSRPRARIHGDGGAPGVPAGGCRGAASTRHSQLDVNSMLCGSRLVLCQPSTPSRQDGSSKSCYLSLEEVVIGTSTIVVLRRPALTSPECGYLYDVAQSEKLERLFHAAMHLEQMVHSMYSQCDRWLCWPATLPGLKSFQRIVVCSCNRRRVLEVLHPASV